MKKYILPLILFLFGFLSYFIATLFRFMHWPFSFELNLLSTFFIIASTIMLIFILIKQYYGNNK